MEYKFGLEIFKICVNNPSHVLDKSFFDYPLFHQQKNFCPGI